MKNFRRFIFTTAMLLLVTASVVFAQIPAEQEEVIIEGGPANMGLLEQTINGDKDENGNRVNPNRVYVLRKDQIYYQQSAINFGGDGDTDATLIIRGESGGRKPLILVQPLDGGGAFQNIINGSLTLENIYWPSTNLDGNSTALFSLRGPDRTVRAKGFITELALGGAPFQLRAVTGKASCFLENCYFRDNTQFANSWNYGIFVRGDNGEPIDTMWVKNTTISNCGMPLFGKFNPVNFMFLDHNTFINTCKYPIWYEQHKEAYVTNNIFINANYEGECQSTWETQMSNSGKNGLISVDPVDNDLWDTDQGMVAPATEEVIFLASNNLSYRSPFLNAYYNGEWNDVGDKPISQRAWGSITEDQLPILVENVPVKLISESAEALIAAYDSYKAYDNYDNTTDPEMVTKGMATQEVADEFIKFMRNNYGVATETETYNRSIMYFGDSDATTFPGLETEEGAGVIKISDFIEDFTYTADIRSTIDGKPLGALTWWEMENNYDKNVALANVKAYYADPENWQTPSSVDSENAIAQFVVFPNPAKNKLHISSKLQLSSVCIYNVIGKKVKEISCNNTYSKTIDISEMKTGLYFVRATSVDGVVKTSKIVKR